MGFSPIQNSGVLLIAERKRLDYKYEDLSNRAGHAGCNSIRTTEGNSRKEDTMSVPVYRALWDVKNNKGRIAIKTPGGKTETIRFDDHAEFVAILNLLNSEKTALERPLFLDTAP
jgi:hypothetical protein